MALSRAFLRSLGIEEDKVTSIIEAHTETVTGLQGRYQELEAKYNELEGQYSTLKATADKLPGIQKELEDLRKEDYKGKYENLFASVEKGKTRAAKEKAVKAYYEGKNIKGSNLNIAMRGTDLEALNLNDKGELEDTAKLDELVAGDFKPLVQAKRTVSSGGSLSGKNEPQLSASDVMNSILRGE